MGIGEKIKEYRIKKNMTQKDLAEQLHVTNQAVSRWENNEVEPSFDTLRSLSAILGCTINDLFDIPTPVAQSSEPQTLAVENLTPDPPPTLLALCEKCNKPIYDVADIHRFTVRIHSGRTNSTQKCLYCTACYDARRKQIEKKAAEERALKIDELKVDRRRSIIWPILIFAALLAIFLVSASEASSRAAGIVISILAFTFSACLFLKNNFIEDLWIGIASWGFVRLPGVIMDFSLGGFIIGLLIKVALWIIGIILAVITVFLATAIAMILSPFVYPFAIARITKAIKNNDPDLNDPEKQKGEKKE